MSLEIAGWVRSALLALAARAVAQSSGSGAEPRLVIEAIGTARAAPDLFHVLIKMDYEAAQTREATVAGYTRNIVFTLPAETAPVPDPLIARLEDLGARFNSHCVTCIGSG